MGVFFVLCSVMQTGDETYTYGHTVTEKETKECCETNGIGMFISTCMLNYVLKNKVCSRSGLLRAPCLRGYVAMCCCSENMWAATDSDFTRVDGHIHKLVMGRDNEDTVTDCGLTRLCQV